MRGRGSRGPGGTASRSKRILKERDRLLRRLSAVSAITGAAFAAGCAIAPDGLSIPLALVVIAASLVAGVAGWLYGVRGGVGYAAAVYLAAIAGVLATAFRSGTSTNEGLIAATVVSGLAALTAASVAAPLVVAPGGLWIASALAVLTLAATAAPIVTGHPVDWLFIAVAVGWGAQAALGRVIEHAGRRASARIAEIGRAHRAERHASEREAQLRQDARVLHDTVLATLSLLAHSGVGVGPDALRQQAGEDARLLRQLRLGVPLEGNSLAFFSPKSDDADLLGSTFELVRQRFGRVGLEVNWHGARRLLLPRETLDALIGALGECLENVRRHSGANQADVTITDDDTMVRAMVTDEGVGFDANGIDGQRLGFAESVVGRLRSVGGRARVFSSPGSGTTVMLEVPKS